MRPLTPGPATRRAALPDRPLSQLIRIFRFAVATKGGKRCALFSSLCLLAAPAAAQYEAPNGDEDTCEALAGKLDTLEKAKQKLSKADEEEFDKCIGFFGCEKTVAAANADKTPPEVVKSNLAMMQYINITCGHKQPLTPGEKFMKEKP